jgi:hypothetical protein
MKHRYLSTKVILPVADGSILLAPEVLDASIAVDPFFTITFYDIYYCKHRCPYDTID